MASGIAHDINNALLPVMPYTETLLEKEPNLSARARANLETITHAIDDVAETIARLSEFYRQPDAPLVLAPVQVNALVHQIIDLTRARWSTMPQQRGIVIHQPSGVYRVPSRLRILVVDDDPPLLQSLCETLAIDGHVVVAAHSGQEGIDAFHAARERREPFAVVITDLGMPHVDGRHVARAVKEASSTTPVILLTGWGQRLVAERDVPPDVDYVLNKPSKLRELRRALAHCRPPAES